MEGLLSSVRQGINELTQSLDRQVLLVGLPFSDIYTGLDYVSKSTSRIKLLLVSFPNFKNSVKRPMSYDEPVDS